MFGLGGRLPTQNPERAGTEGKQQQGAGNECCRFGNGGRGRVIIRGSVNVSTGDDLLIVTVATKGAAIEDCIVNGSVLDIGIFLPGYRKKAKG